ncbi:MAG: MerR family transcriptional regulator [Clostridiales bacterium]|jgi:DNA-binding transcriptional MerR regulator|nr:MerR family transcriptional regulator [Clostridiales bacterium]
MKKYNISQTARMLGLSSELLRHYERKGLLAPLRNENGYRAYTRPDIYILSGIRMLRNAGYSLKDIERLFAASYEEALALRKQRCAKIEEEIEHSKLVLEALREEYGEIAMLRENHGAITRAVSPPMLRVNNQVNDSFLVERGGSILRWVEHMPIVKVSPSFSKDAVLAGREEIRFGYAVPLALAERLGLAGTDGAEIKPETDCLTTVVYSIGANYLDARSLGHIPDYCYKEGLRIAGDPWGLTIATITDDGQHNRFHRFYIPVR